MPLAPRSPPPVLSCQMNSVPPEWKLAEHGRGLPTGPSGLGSTPPHTPTRPRVVTSCPAAGPAPGWHSLCSGRPWPGCSANPLLACRSLLGFNLQGTDATSHRQCWGFFFSCVFFFFFRGQKSGETVSFNKSPELWSCTFSVTLPGYGCAHACAHLANNSFLLHSAGIEVCTGDHTMQKEVSRGHMAHLGLVPFARVKLKRRDRPGSPQEADCVL